MCAQKYRMMADYLKWSVLGTRSSFPELGGHLAPVMDAPEVRGLCLFGCLFDDRVRAYSTWCDTLKL